MLEEFRPCRPVPSISASTGMAASNPRAEAGRLYTTQCTQVPPASGSSMISTKLCVPAGGSVQVSWGEVFSPSQENETGIASPSAKAGLLITRLGASVAVGGIAVDVGSAVADAHAESR